MYFCICISILFYNAYSSNAADSKTDNALVKLTDIADVFLNLFNNDKNDERLKDLKEKLSKIESYSVDREKHTELIRNASSWHNLNETNFYDALQEKDHFRLLNRSKNLYMTLKEKMNSDDLLRILAERGDEKVKLSARRMITGDTMLQRDREKDLAETVDKYLSEIVSDYHTFDDPVNIGRYWDPKNELEERRQYKQQSNRRLYKGERTNIKYYPFMVSVHVMGRFWCGGSIYWNDLIITSAACLQIVYNNRFYRENPKAITVRVGSNHSRLGGEMVDALEVYFHPSYSPKTLNNNIALIRLRREIHINYHHRAPKLIQISHNDQGIPFTAQVLLLGWGSSKEHAGLPTEPLFLHRKFLPIYPATYCKDIYGEKFNKENMFCAGTVTTGEGACNHDAGGPAILNGKLVGIISYGPTVCGFPDAPTVLTMVGYYSDWIETVNESMPGYYRFVARTTTTTESTISWLFENWKGQNLQNLKRLSPKIFVNNEASKEDKDTETRTYHERSVNLRTTEDEEGGIQPIPTVSSSKVYNNFRQSSVLLTKRRLKKKIGRVDEDIQKEEIEEPKQVPNNNNEEEEPNEGNENQDDREEENIIDNSPLTSLYDKGLTLKPVSLLQLLKNVTFLISNDKDVQKTSGSNNIKPLRNKQKRTTIQTRFIQKSDTYNIQNTPDDNYYEKQIQNDKEIEAMNEGISFLKNNDIPEINIIPNQQDHEYENNNIESEKQQLNA